MAFSELAITDVFPMRKRRAVDPGTTKLNSKRGLDNAKGEQTKPNSCISKTPNSKVSSTITIPRRNAAKSPKGRNDTQLPLHTPTRLNFPPSDALGRPIYIERGLKTHNNVQLHTTIRQSRHRIL